MDKIFHYTVVHHLQSIFGDDEIKVATKYVPKGVKPVVWFTTKQDWDETANKQIGLDNGELSEPLGKNSLWEYGQEWLKRNKENPDLEAAGNTSTDQQAITSYCPIRIEVDPKKVSLCSWNNYKKNSGDSKKAIRALEKTAKQKGSDPKQWLVSYENVPMSAVLGISNWDGEKWQPWLKDE